MRRSYQELVNSRVVKTKSSNTNCFVSLSSRVHQNLRVKVAESVWLIYNTWRLFPAAFCRGQHDDDSVSRCSRTSWRGLIIRCERGRSIRVLNGIRWRTIFPDSHNGIKTRVYYYIYLEISRHRFSLEWKLSRFDVVFDDAWKSK